MSNPDTNSEARESAQTNAPGRKFLLDLGPLVLFFATNYATGDFMLAVKVLVGPRWRRLPPAGFLNGASR